MRIVLAGPADFVDANGVVIELGMRVALVDDGMVVGYGEVCLFDDDSARPIGVSVGSSPYDGTDGTRWMAVDEVIAL